FIVFILRPSVLSPLFPYTSLFRSPVALYGLDRPFLLMNAGFTDEGEVDSHRTADDRASFWNQSSGWKLDVAIPNGAHYTFTDHRSEEHTSELQSRENLVCRLLLEK